MPKISSDHVASFLVLMTGIGLLAFNVSQPRALAPVVPSVAEVELVGVNAIPIYADPLDGRATSSAEVQTQMDRFSSTLSAQAIYVMDVPSASILLAKNAQDARSPASTTKLLSALVSLDVYAPQQVLTIANEGEIEGAVMGLQPGEAMTVDSLLAGLLVQSGNDAAQVLANNHPQGYQGFVAAMNYKASELGLENSSFSNPAGLDWSDHLTTARDLAIISREVMKHPVLRPLVSTKQIVISDTTLTQTHFLTNTNELLGSEPGVIGVKTGTTELAGQVLITQLQRNGQEILVVIMGSQDRYFDTKQIYNWVFNHYVWTDPESGTLK